MDDTSRDRLLIISADDPLRISAARIFSVEYDVIEADGKHSAIEALRRRQGGISLALLDSDMLPGEGLELLDWMGRPHQSDPVPVVLLSAHDDVLLPESLEHLVADIIQTPINSTAARRRIKNIIAMRTWRTAHEDKAEQLARVDLQVIEALSSAVSLLNIESGEHLKRMGLFVKELLEAINGYYSMNERTIDLIACSCALHDIGKIVIPEFILQKPGRLTDEEFNIVKQHTLRGCEMLEGLDYLKEKEYYTYCYEICRYHHERWDGGGYPDGLSGDDIPIWAQAASLADVYDALTSKRVNKDAYAHAEVVRMILNGECGVFNPLLLETLLKVEDRLYELSKLHDPHQIIDPARLV